MTTIEMIADMRASYASFGRTVTASEFYILPHGDRVCAGRVWEDELMGDYGSCQWEKGRCTRTENATEREASPICVV